MSHFHKVNNCRIQPIHFTQPFVTLLLHKNDWLLTTFSRHVEPMLRIKFSELFFFFFPVQRSLSCNGVTRRTIQRVITRVINHRWQDKHILLTWSQIPKVHFCACLFSQVFAKLKRQNPSRAKSKLSNPLVFFFYSVMLSSSTIINNISASMSIPMSTSHHLFQTSVPTELCCLWHRYRCPLLRLSLFFFCSR